MQFLSFGLVSSVAIAIVLIVVLTKAVKFVPQNRAFVVERFGKYTRTLEAGLNFLNPFFGVVIANIILDEVVTFRDFIGVFIITGGILAVQLSNQESR